MTYRYGASRHPGDYTYGVAGLGVRGDAIPQSGTHGPGLLAADVVLPGEAADEFMYRVTVVPPLLTLFRYFDDSGVEAEGPPGLHTGQAERRRNGVVYGTAPFYVLIGSTLGGSIAADDAVAAGAMAPAPPAVISGSIASDDAVASGALALVPAAVLSGAVVTADAVPIGLLGDIQRWEPNLYRRAARDILAGRVTRTDGNDVMLRVGARRRRY